MPGMHRPIKPLTRSAALGNARGTLQYLRQVERSRRNFVKTGGAGPVGVRRLTKGLRQKVYNQRLRVRALSRRV